jgi:exonuclease VII small subunit
MICQLVHTAANLSKAFKDLTRGEQTATALEAHLTDLERKIEELLARADEDERNRLNRSDESSHPDPPSETDSGSA